MSEEHNQPQDQNQPADATGVNPAAEEPAAKTTPDQASTYTHDGNAYGEPGVIPPAPVPSAPVPPASQTPVQPNPAQPQQSQAASQQQPVPPAPQQYYDHNGYPAPAPEQQVPADQAPAQPQQPQEPQAASQQPGQPYPPHQGQPYQQGQSYQQPGAAPYDPNQQQPQQGWNQQGQPYQGDPNDLNDPNNPNSPYNPNNPNNPNSPYAQAPGCLSFGAGSQAGVGYDPNLKLTTLNKVVWIVIGFVCNFFGVLLAWLFGMMMPAQVRYQIVKYACIGFFIEFALLLIFGYFGGGEMVGSFISGDGGASTAAPSGGESAGSGGSGGSGSSAWG